ncbi:MAG TPA: ATP-binding protein [Usitatibacter sp.]|jgi:signal transduction histidine kinase/ActR/RegA family two-component response regulator|nr:ATP-binding protein [Usitatibacter sp.]
MDGAPMKVVVVSPNPADSSLAVGFLEAQGLGTIACPSLTQLGPMVSTGIACVVVVEEALVEPEMHVFHEALHAQPAWSDLPLILIAARESSLSVLVEGVFPRSGNVTLLQRPLHPVTLVSAVNVALRSRQRQLEVRDLLTQREDAVKRRDEFLAMLAHELRNPLAPIRNAAYILGTLGNTDPVFMKCRSMIEKQARHVARLVDDLLDVSRLELGKVELRRQRMDLNDALSSAAEACAPMTALHRHVVRVRRADAALMVHADPVRLEQVIGNLIVNAAKFTPDGGAIDLSAFADNDREAVVCVADNGVGIRPEMLESVFDLFVQGAVTKARTEGGLGIGLTLVKHLMDLHGGSVRAFSDGPGRGARFEARLPLDREMPCGLEAIAPGAANAHPRRVLIVEDGNDSRDSLGMLLEAWDHEVFYASSGPEAVRHAREKQPDVAVIDIGLPGFDGYQVARQIRLDGSEWAHRIRLIALTGYGQPADRARALDSGFDVHVLKPVDPSQLQALIAAPVVSKPEAQGVAT